MSSWRRCWKSPSGKKNVNERWRPKRRVWCWLCCVEKSKIMKIKKMTATFPLFPPRIIPLSALCFPIGQRHATRRGNWRTRREKATKVPNCDGCSIWFTSFSYSSNSSTQMFGSCFCYGSLNGKTLLISRIIRTYCFQRNSGERKLPFTMQSFSNIRPAGKLDKKCIKGSRK